MTPTTQKMVTPLIQGRWVIMFCGRWGGGGEERRKEGGEKDGRRREGKEERGYSSSIKETW